MSSKIGKLALKSNFMIKLFQDGKSLTVQESPGESNKLKKYAKVGKMVEIVITEQYKQASSSLQETESLWSGFRDKRLLWFYFSMLSDWLIKLAPLFQPIRSKTKTGRVFPRLAPVTCICFEF